MAGVRFSSGFMSDSILHEFIAIDEGLGTLLHVDQRKPEHNWVVPIGREQARDLQLVGGHRLLVGHHLGYTEFDVRTGQTLKEVISMPGVTSVRRLINGHTRLAGVNLLGETGVVLAELDSEDQVRSKRVLEGDYVRLIRETSAGTFLMMCNTKIRVTDLSGATLREISVNGFAHAWKAVRRPNGNILSSAGYGAFLIELDPHDQVIRKFGTKEQVSPEVRPFFYAMFQLLPNEHVVVANWQGHGAGNGASGRQLLEFDPTGAIVWSWSEADLISSLQGVVMLDGLDTSLPHDEREGVMRPL